MSAGLMFRFCSGFWAAKNLLRKDLKIFLNGAFGAEMGYLKGESAKKTSNLTKKTFYRNLWGRAALLGMGGLESEIFFIVILGSACVCDKFG